MPARLLDEPESALSFENCLALGAALHALARRNDAQVLLATHSPVLAAIPGARLLELGPLGWAESTWEDLRLVGHWRAFLADPHRYWRHALDQRPIAGATDRASTASVEPCRRRRTSPLSSWSWTSPSRPSAAGGRGTTGPAPSGCHR